MISLYLMVGCFLAWKSESLHLSGDNRESSLRGTLALTVSVLS